MPAERTTADTILAAAQRSIRRRGPQKLSLSAVAEEAGVSRPTVYRWFPTKALLLAAITAYEVEQFDTGLQALADAYDGPTERFEAALRYMVTYLDETIGADAISADPAFALQSLADSLGPHIDSVAGVLGDALDQIPAVSAGSLTREEGAEMLLRVAYSHYLVPNPDPDRLVATLRRFAGIERRARRRSSL
ncbi:MAG TPA: helix-turn-helix domain-containing protein [Acidimicrobiia bacterium]|jgi:AcrR family transcriptional regulator